MIFRLLSRLFSSQNSSCWLPINTLSSLIPHPPSRLFLCLWSAFSCSYLRHILPLSLSPPLPSLPSALFCPLLHTLLSCTLHSALPSALSPLPSPHTHTHRANGWEAWTGYLVTRQRQRLPKHTRDSGQLGPLPVLSPGILSFPTNQPCSRPQETPRGPLVVFLGASCSRWLGGWVGPGISVYQIVFCLFFCLSFFFFFFCIFRLLFVRFCLSMSTVIIPRSMNISIVLYLLLSK